MNHRPSPRLEAGHVFAPFQLTTLAHGTIEVPDREHLVHLQFRRFAGCPVCSLHLRSFARRRAELEAAGVRVIAFFHSSADALRPYHADLPFPVVPDAERRWYRRFGVERSLRALAHPRAMWEGARGLALAPSNPLRGEGGANGLPADFLVDRDGRLRAVHYGQHAADHWEVEEVVRLAG